MQPRQKDAPGPIPGVPRPVRAQRDLSSPANFYRPGDHVDPDPSHVIPAIIKKCLDAIKEGGEELVVWGDGTPTREFLYVDDAAEGIVLAMERYGKPDPINLGSGIEISIKNLVERLTSLTGFEGRIVWDTTRPNGQPRSQLDTTRPTGESVKVRVQIPKREVTRRLIGTSRPDSRSTAAREDTSPANRRKHVSSPPRPDRRDKDRIASTLELVRNGALLFEPLAPEKFADVMYRSPTRVELRRTLLQAGRKRCQRFSWERTARETLKVPEVAAANRTRPLGNQHDRAR